jgi:opacity protein-like surface antigen
MRKKHLLAAITVAVGMATALAAPASADEQLDQAFLEGLQQNGVSVKTPELALELAHSTCDLLENGGTVQDALSMLTKKTKWSVKKATDFGGFAVYAYCKDKLPAETS